MLASIDKITSKEGLGMSPRRITVSTSGVPKMIKKLADDRPKFHLALSLHSAIDEKRVTIMPFNEQFPLADIKEALTYWYDITGTRVTYEYVVWKGINDTPNDVHALVKFCKLIPCKVNIIEYNSIDDPRFEQASDDAIELYKTALEKQNIIVNVRRSRGKDIDAACGQLANKS
jgi:23S rRNA (adenine2503-C2)-methyltransferase